MLLGEYFHERINPGSVVTYASVLSSLDSERSAAFAWPRRCLVRCSSPSPQRPATAAMSAHTPFHSSIVRMQLGLHSHSHNRLTAGRTVTISLWRHRALKCHVCTKPNLYSHANITTRVQTVFRTTVPARLNTGGPRITTVSYNLRYNFS